MAPIARRGGGWVLVAFLLAGFQPHLASLARRFEPADLKLINATSGLTKALTLTNRGPGKVASAAQHRRFGVQDSSPTLVPDTGGPECPAKFG